ncbi:MAG TPA: hypothetical protein VHB50_22260, partial [Bryobacteraceae bacterium]|nr:hypothetical protein [Bryobacteraceae bacterium]
MRSLFTKILLWMLLTVAVSNTLSFYIGTTLQRSSQPQFSGRGLTFELREAREAWEAEGRDGLERMLARIKDAINAEVALTDSTGRDLL